MKHLVVTLLLGLATIAAAAQSDLLELTTEKVVVFKDGHCLIIKSGKATTDENGRMRLHEVPSNVVLGTFWAHSTTGEVLNMRAGWETLKNTREEEITCKGHLQILQANKGRKCRLSLNGQHYEGTIHEVLAEKTDIAVNTGAHAGFHHLAAIRPQSVSTVSHLNGSYFVLRQTGSDVLLPVNGIQSLQIEKMKTSMMREKITSTKRKQLTFQFKEPNKEHDIRIMYFGPGLRWIPTYRINLDDKTNKATVELQAELINEIEDLSGVPIDIVVGVPNFRFKTTSSPLTLESTLRNALHQAVPNLMNQQVALSNASYSLRSTEHRRNAAANTGADVNLPNELKGGSSHDLFLYNLPPLDLAKGERAAVHIFKQEVNYRDVYTWEVKMKLTDLAMSPSGSGLQSPLELSNNHVWHQIELINSTGMPWTTGAAMIMAGNQPLAQELLPYTPVKETTRVPVTIAVDILPTLEGKETGRTPGALSWHGNSYAKIEREVKLGVCNHKSKDIVLEVRARFGGKVEKANNDGAISIHAFNRNDWHNYRGNHEVNNSSIVKWSKTLKPGDVFAPTINLHYFARH